MVKRFTLRAGRRLEFHQTKIASFPGSLNTSNRSFFTLNVLYHTMPHKLCGCEEKHVHGVQCFVQTHSEESDSVLFIPSLQQHMLLASAFSKQNSAISFEESVLVFILFTTSTRLIDARQAAGDAWHVRPCSVTGGA